MHTGPLSCVPRQISVVSAACFVGVFVFIARSSHAAERPPLLVTFDRASGVSGCSLILVARRWVIRHGMMHLRGRLGGTYMVCRVCCVFLVARFICNYCTLSHTSYGFVSARALRCARAVVDSGAASSLSRSLEAGFFLLASCRLLVTSRGFVVSPALVRFLRLPSPLQFRP